MPKLYNLARVSTATTGAGTVTLGAAVSGYLSFAGAGASDGDVVWYGIKDGANSEVGYGVYSSSGPTLTRNPYKSTNANAALALSGSAEVFITALAGDGGDMIPSTTNPYAAAGVAINLQINASVASNVLTVAIKGNNGADPSNTNPVLVPFRDSTSANGNPVWRAVTSSLSINTNAVGATLGTSNNTPFRLWVVAFDNTGTVQLALINCTASGTIFPLTEYALKSTTGMSAAATSAGVFYTPNGVSLTSKAFCVLGFVEYSSGLTTAGTYNVAPTIVQVAGPFTPRPGAVIQSVQAQDTAQSTNATTAFANTTTAVSITPTSAANAVAVAASGTLGNTGTYYAVAQISRGGTKVGQAQTVVGAAQSYGPCALLYTDTPGSNGLLTYTVQIKTSNASGSAVWNTTGPGVGSVIVATEIMG